MRKTEKYIYKGIFSKKMLYISLFLFAVYFLGFSSLLKADYDYWDDGVRFLNGGYGWTGQGRYLTEWVMHFMVLEKMVDTSPLFQIISIAILSISTCILLYVYASKINWLVVALSLSFGFNPFFLECLSYKIDSLIMALSVLFAVLPMLFTDNLKRFSIASAVCLAIMINLYQSSSGLYIILVVFYCYKLWAYDGRSLKDAFIFGACAAGVFCVVVGGFSLWVSLNGLSWRNVDPISVHVFFPSLWNNIKVIFQTAWSSFSIVGIVFIILSFITGIIFSTIKSKQNKIVAAAIITCVVLFSLLFSQSQFLLLEEPVLMARTIYCIGYVLPILLIISVPEMSRKWWYYIVAGYTVWTFFITSLVYGNALNKQKNFDARLAEFIGYDLSIYNGNASIFSFEGDPELAPEVELASRAYPVLRKIVQSNLSTGYDYNAFTYYVTRNGLEYEFTSEPFDTDSASLVFDRKLYSLYENDNRIHLVIK